MQKISAKYECIHWSHYCMYPSYEKTEKIENKRNKGDKCAIRLTKKDNAEIKEIGIKNEKQ